MENQPNGNSERKPTIVEEALAKLHARMPSILDERKRRQEEKERLLGIESSTSSILRPNLRKSHTRRTSLHVPKVEPISVRTEVDQKELFTDEDGRWKAKEE